MGKNEVLNKLKKCEVDLKSTSSPMRKKDLLKHKRRLQKRNESKCKRMEQ